MRLRFTLLLCVGFATAQAQVWEKFIAEGLTYRMEVDLSTPRIIHALRFHLKSGVQAKPEVASSSIFASNPAGGKQVISELVKSTGAVAGINADFFGRTNDPIGFMVSEGRLHSTPWKNRSVFGWGEEIAQTATTDVSIQVATQSGVKIAVDGINQETGENDLVLFTDKASMLKTKINNLVFLYQAESGEFRIGETTRGEFLNRYREASDFPLQKGNFALVATGSKRAQLERLGGESIQLQITASGFDWGRVRHAVGGGPDLVRQSQISIDAQDQGFNESFSDKRHPRTAIGKTANGEIWIVCIDGRQSMSDGATLKETAQIMLRLGCTDAVNLDGGGSTTFNLLGLTLNRPSDGRERPVANGILFFAPHQMPPVEEPKIVSPEALVAGTAMNLTVVDKNGTPIPNSAILWSASGSAWIDQGGLIRPYAAGTTSVVAWVGGKEISVAIPIKEAPPRLSRSSKRGGTKKP